MGSKIFISHSSADKDIAERLCVDIESLGFNCWVAFRDISGGSNYLSEIPSVLRSANAMIVMLSSNANCSVEIPRELSLADQFGIPIIPIRSENFEFNDAFQYVFSTRQYIDMFPSWERGICQLLAQLRASTKISINRNRIEELRIYQIIENAINRQALHRLPFDAATRLVEDIATSLNNATDPAPYAASLLVLRVRYFIRNGIMWRGPQREELLRQATPIDSRTAMHLAKVLGITHEDFVKTIYNA